MLCVLTCFPGCCIVDRASSPTPSQRRRSSSVERASRGSGLAYDIWRSSMINTVSPSISMQTRALAPVTSQPMQTEGVLATSQGTRGLRLDVEACARRLYTSGPGLDYTPKGTEAKGYKYYCPLCMRYFKGTFESTCCRHYLCFDCLLAYVANKYGVTAADLPYLEVPFLFPLPCPHCNSLDFEPGAVSRLAEVRSYEDDAEISAVLEGLTPSQHSPVRPGDSFEKLQRKMLRFNSQDSSSGLGCVDIAPLTPADSVSTIMTCTTDNDTDQQVEGVRGAEKVDSVKLKGERERLVPAGAASSSSSGQLAGVRAARQDGMEGEEKGSTDGAVTRDPPMGTRRGGGAVGEAQLKVMSSPSASAML